MAPSTCALHHGPRPRYTNVKIQGRLPSFVFRWSKVVVIEIPGEMQYASVNSSSAVLSNVSPYEAAQSGFRDAQRSIGEAADTLHLI
jgi:hypothetical protein